MPRVTTQAKQQNFNFRVSADLKAAFQDAAERADKPAAQVIRDFMRNYVYEHETPEPGHDAWFRAQVQKALNDPRPRIPHGVVMKRTRDLLDRLIAEKQSRED